MIEDSMIMCPDCGYSWSGEVEVESRRKVFCPKHDFHDAVYIDGHPIGDRCPQCVIEKYEKALQEISMFNVICTTPYGPVYHLTEVARKALVK